MNYTVEQLTTMIADARSAYHELQVGRSARVIVDSNNERAEFTAANRSSLYVYIQGLERQLAELTGTSDTLNPTLSPARMIF